MSNLTPFKINTSRNLCTFCISLIRSHLKPPIINTSVNFDFKLPRINTCKKTGGGGSSCNSSCNWRCRARQGNAVVLCSGSLEASILVRREKAGGLKASATLTKDNPRDRARPRVPSTAPPVSYRGNRRWRRTGWRASHIGADPLANRWSSARSARWFPGRECPIRWAAWDSRRRRGSDADRNACNE